ncbi:MULTISPECIES: S26 family signal peptidase [unclassified Sphingobium]|uniref:S26 family signal peptidase n=1 Tax=unclassified Sphingobium TaxID=2611147 RepID=UPI000D1787BF|nr:MULTISPECIES: S26 family signal peptidase [unclassified Sphingobium]MBG6118643.1 conjugative transfer signal peptidase TraF [Sphingobium sp. JAI105]PSO13673.1 S26 family signal peptidase [Sphingobium sp. AEW4]TWD10676.1 conjugative transfer signal peptidase TraF [Sphingobium sp. AEW010]TWD27919.1 conjugative transfer signal peptidase TraF [Sphingobium sp. AEW013]TWD29010.1 conjugative transfer signal peptidase TraF [Sphingobium sp. AEW001]
MTRLGYAITTTAAVSLLGALSLVSFGPKLIWNASASTPIGLYAIEPDPSPKVADLVAVRVPEPLASFLAEGSYLPRGVPLMKRVVALPGQRVCRTGLAITVDAVPMGEALDRDRRGNRLPVWQGCRVVADGELFLMNREVRDSLDGRYFGPLPASAVIGRAIPLYTDEDGDDRFVWRAPTR